MRRLKSLAFLGLPCLLLVGCGGASTTTSSTVQVRVIDVLHSTGNVGLDVNGAVNIFANNIVYGTVQAYGSASTTPQMIGVTEHGSSTVVVTSATFSFAPNSKTTLLLTGTEGSGATMTEVSDDTSHPATNDFKLRLIHGAQLAGGDVDLYLLPPAGNINTASPFVASLAYGDASSFVEFLAGSAEVLKIVPAGQKAPILASLSLTPASGDIDTVLMQDSGVSIATAILPN